MEYLKFLTKTRALFEKPKYLTEVRSWQGHIPFALWAIEAFKPLKFVELGTHLGDSYFAFCQSAAANNLDCQLFAVDTWMGDSQAGYYANRVYERVREQNREYEPYSHLLRMTFDEALSKVKDGTVDLLHIDGLHTYEAVRHDFETWKPKLSDRAVVLFHDTVVKAGDFGVWKFWDELKSQFPSFEFLHSNGLGVLGVGENLPEMARDLVSLRGEEAEFVQRLFCTLGDGVLQTSALNDVLHAEGKLRLASEEFLKDESANFNEIFSSVPDSPEFIGEMKKFSLHLMSQIRRLATPPPPARPGIASRILSRVIRGAR